MKKLFFVLLFFFPCITQAKFANIDIDPTCMISGYTATKVWHGKSDTSSWDIPYAYEGPCRETPQLSEKEKEIIFKKMQEYFVSKKYTPRIQDFGNGNTQETEYMNNLGVKFVKEKYFPILQEKIVNEISKTTPNMWKIAVYNYLVQIVGYDYRLMKRDQ